MVASIEKRDLADSLRVKVVTDVSLRSLVQGSTDVSALMQLMEHVWHVSVRYLPRIHAKVYVSGDDFALITSANFTDGGSCTNFEYGVAIEDAAYVRAISVDIGRYADLGGSLSLQHLKELDNHVTELRAAIREEQRSMNAKLRAAATLEREAEDQLLRSRVEERSIYAVFGDTILYLLASGPMTTMALHERIQGIHPDLCDDSLDRVIDGQHFAETPPRKSGRL
jgi:PLD-like domain